MNKINFLHLNNKVLNDFLYKYNYVLDTDHLTKIVEYGKSKMYLLVDNTSEFTLQVKEFIITQLPKCLQIEAQNE